MTIDLNGNELEAVVAALQHYALTGNGMGDLEIEEIEGLAERLEIILNRD